MLAAAAVGATAKSADARVSAGGGDAWVGRGGGGWGCFCILLPSMGFSAVAGATGGGG